MNAQIDRILIAYDGSDNSKHAIKVAGQLFPTSDRAEVVHAWEPVSSAAARAAVYGIPWTGSEEIIDAERKHAEEVVGEGAQLARDAGFQAEGRGIEGSGPTWDTLLTAIEEVHPDLVVMGTRGLSGVRAAVVGSVSHQVVTHSSVPVLIVPPAG